MESLNISLQVLLLGLFLVPALFVTLMGPAVISWCRAHELVAPLCNRSAHKKLTPHGGGIIVALTIVPVCLMLAAMGLLDYPVFWVVLMILSCVLTFVGWCDDKKHVNPFLRLVVQFICVGGALSVMPQLFDFVPVWVEKGVLLFAWVWFINLYNFMDGLDGLATSEAVFLSMALALLVPSLVPVAALVAGASFGFLRVNAAPAKVFLGDMGSTFLGYILGGMLLISIADNTWRLAFPLFTLTLVFSFDTTYSVIRRILKGHKPWQPHREFWFHRAAISGLSHGTVVLWVFALNLLLFIIALLGVRYDWGWFTIAIGLLLMLLPVIGIKRREEKHSHDPKSN